MPRLTTTPTKRSRRQLESSMAATMESPSYCNTKSLLSCSYIDGLIGRDDEYKTIYDRLQTSLRDKQSFMMYISGPAGTGKTLTTHTVINDIKNGKQFKFKFISMNCMSFQSAADFYNKIIQTFQTKTKRSLTNNSSTSNNQLLMDQMKNCIENTRHEMIILVLDEVDQLQTKNQDVLNNLFNLPNIFPNKIILIGIANALDFTAKMSWLKTADNCHFQQIRFLPYRKEQIVQIIENRLKLANNNSDNDVLIDRMAIEFCARKIASCSGDIRKALDVCRRAIELIENDHHKCTNTTNIRANNHLSPLKSRENLNQADCPVDQPKQVNIRIMMDVLNKVYGNAVDKIAAATKIEPNSKRPKTFLPSDQQVILCAFLILIKTRSIREVKLSSLRDLLMKICQRNGISSEGKSESDIVNMCQYLADYGYVQVTKKELSASGKMSGSSPFKRMTPSKRPSASNSPAAKNGSSITVSLMIEPQEAEQLISQFHQSIIADAFLYQ